MPPKIKKMSAKLNKIVNSEITKALTPNEIFSIAGKTCNVIKYPDLSEFNSIDEIFEEGNSLYGLMRKDLPFDEDSCIILYMSKPNFGHWCTVNRYRDKNGNTKRIDFLDSYGDMIDDQLDYINNKFRGQSNQLTAHLCKLLDKADVPVHFNNVQLQVFGGNISTCGRYAALFLKHNNMKVENFTNSLLAASEKYKIPIDRLVTLMTLDL